MTRMPKANKKEFLKIHEECLGIVTASCKKANVSRTTFYKWLKEDEAFAQKIQEIDEVQGDFVENQLLKAIKEGDVSAIIYYCKTKLKKRGYGMVMDVNARVEAKAEVKPDLSAIPDELLEQVLKNINGE